jgi:hypothetical protein
MTIEEYQSMISQRNAGKRIGETKEYRSMIDRAKSAGKIITVSRRELNDYIPIAEERIISQSGEDGHVLDPRSNMKRILSGFVCERATEIQFGFEIVDYKKRWIGLSYSYNHGDLVNVGIRCGVKGFLESSLFPLVHSTPFRPELLWMILTDHEEDTLSDVDVILLGLISTSAMRKFSSDELVNDESCRNRGRKTAFWNFDELIHIHTAQELKDTCANFDKQLPELVRNIDLNKIRKTLLKMKDKRF